MKKLATKLFESNPDGLEVECPHTDEVLHITDKDWRTYFLSDRKTRNLVERDGFYCPTCDAVHCLEYALVR